ESGPPPPGARQPYRCPDPCPAAADEPCCCCAASCTLIPKYCEPSNPVPSGGRPSDVMIGGGGGGGGAVGVRSQASAAPRRASGATRLAIRVNASGCANIVSSVGVGHYRLDGPTVSRGGHVPMKWSRV